MNSEKLSQAGKEWRSIYKDSELLTLILCEGNSFTDLDEPERKKKKTTLWIAVHDSESSTALGNLPSIIALTLNSLTAATIDSIHVAWHLT